MRFWVKRKEAFREALLKHAYSKSLPKCTENHQDICINHDKNTQDFCSRHGCTCNLRFMVMRTHNASDLPLPKRQTPAAAGMDLHANIQESLTIKKGSRALVPTGIKLALPFGFEGQVRPRSGLAFKYGVTVLNAPGTVDADYRGELCALLINLGDEDFTIQRGDRIAQLIIAKVEMAELTETDSLPETLRGEGGYGSTGINGCVSPH